MTTARDAAAESIPVDSLSFEELDPYDGAALVSGDQDAGPHDTMIRINAGDDTSELTHRNAFTAVPATGSLNIDDGSSVTELPTGSVIEFEANTPHSLSCGQDPTAWSTCSPIRRSRFVAGESAESASATESVVLGLQVDALRVGRLDDDIDR